MNLELTVISILFFVSAFIYVFWGIYIMYIDSKTSTNRLFLLICISISIWSFGFGMANIAENLESALFWHRFSALGWTTSYGFVLHFLILLSRDKVSLKEKKLYWLLHIPGIISMYIFGISNKMAPMHYNLLKNQYGWINRLTNNHWDTFFNLYYMSYMLLAICIVWNWQRKSENKVIAKRGKIILLTLVVSSLIGTLTDRIASLVFENPLPQMAPLFILIPSWAMYHSARYYRIMEKKTRDIPEMILSEEDKESIFTNISIALYGAAILVFIFEYMPGRNQAHSLKWSLIKASTLIVIGIIIRNIQNIKKQSLKEDLTIIVLVGSVPIVLLQFLNYGSMTVWAYPMVIIISSIVFSKRTLLISTTLVSIITQILIWILRPEITVVINKSDYILRIGMFVAAFLTGLFINKIYVDKIKENEFQSRFQKMNARISSDFIRINRENIDEKFNKMLLEIGLFFNPDQISLFLISDDDKRIIYSYEWCNEGIDSKIETFESLNFEDFSWWREELKNNKVVSIEDTGKISKMAIKEKEQIDKLNIKSLISVPVEGKNRISAFLLISSINTYRKWPKEDIKLLHILANLISDALLKIKSEEEVEYMAYYDSLTGLPNIILFKDRFNKAIKLAKNMDTLISVMYIDLENFKSVNAIIGYQGGDELLKKVSQRLKKLVGKSIEVARFNGDEFIISIKDIENHNDILEVVDNVLKVFSEPYYIGGQELSINCNAGISTYPRDGADAEILIENANLAMHYINEKGKSQYKLYKPNMKKETEEKLSLLNDLKGAVERNELVLYYQPQVNLITGKINGAEALVRWNHPKLGMISPGVFIPLAEENGLINSIGEWVLKTACIQNKKWQDMNLLKLPIGVNLSAVQLINFNIVNFIEKTLKESGLDSKYLELEITESVTIEDIEYIEKILNKLKEMGMVIAIDDFGTEHSSFSRLKTLYIDRIKIDMEFIQGIEKNEKDRTIIKIMINLAKGLGVNVIAEGVETKAQLDFLKDNGCDDVQGYYYKPMAREEMEKLL